MKGMLVVMILLPLLFIAPAAFAKEKSRGAGAEKTGKPHAGQVGEEWGREVMEAVSDEITGDTGSAKGRPLGLSKKDELPKGLEKQGKIPPGWEKGKKRGWEEPYRESKIRRLIRGIFRKPQTSTGQE